MTRLLWLLLLIATPLAAHQPSDSYLRLQIEAPGAAGVSGRWDIALRDLDAALVLDADGDGQLRWGELAPREAEVLAYAGERLRLAWGEQPCALRWQPLQIVELGSGAHAALAFDGDCPPPPGLALVLRYGLLFDLDPSHRGLLQLAWGERQQTAVFSPERREQRFDGRPPEPLAVFAQYFGEGVRHIALGLDHLLFLAGLLLPAVLARRDGRWVAAPSARHALIEVAGIVTAFTLAHALSLSLAALGGLSLPARWVEAAVAATVVFAALNTLLPLVRGRLWALAFGFGLIHGAGYAGVLGDLGLSGGLLALALLAFNLGVEGMQLLVALVWVPLAFALRRQPLYQWGVVGGGSLLVTMIGVLWLLERLFQFRFVF
ncbi:MAG TPA: HupE/UreJ family protein [Nevskiaceae bacterium]|nr:HupE/UreJ family protein [Nevskiaceae bacterium]